MSHVLSCQLAGGLMIDGIIIEIVTLSGMVDCIEERRQDRRRRLCDARLPIGLASDAPYRNAQTKMRRVAPALASLISPTMTSSSFSTETAVRCAVKVTGMVCLPYCNH
jgi:hypothetical protein